MVIEILELVVPIILLILGFIPGMKWYQQFKHKWIFEIIKEAVIWVNRRYVENKKAENRKLTNKEAAEMREKAKAKAKEYAEARGIKLQRKLSDEYIDLMIENAVHQLKKE